MNITTLHEGRVKLIHGDCLGVMRYIKPNSIDMVFADLPYGTTACKWDTLINLTSLWKLLKLVGKSTTPYIFTASQPFTTILNSSNLDWLRYEWVWDKRSTSNFALANKQPLKSHENISVFYEKQPTYNPIKVLGAKNHSRGTNTEKFTEIYGRTMREVAANHDGLKFPRSILDIQQHASYSKLHPTEKHIDLLEYLIKTYTNENATVLDPTMGSGTTGEACVKLNRKFIGIELDENYYNIAVKRIASAQCSL